MAGSARITNQLPPKAAQDNAVWWVNTQGFPKEGGTISTHMDNYANDPSTSSGLAIGGFHYYVDPTTLATRPVNPGETWDYATSSTQLQIQQNMYFSTAVAKEASLAYASPEVQSMATSAAMGGNGSLNPFIKNWQAVGGPNDPGGTPVTELNPAAYGNYGMTSRDSGFLQAYASSNGDAQSGLAALGGTAASGGMQAGMSALQGGGTNVATPPTKNGNSSAGCIGAAIGAIASIAAAGLLSGVAKNWHDLGQQFISIGIVRATTFADVAAALAKIDPGLNLNHLSQLSTPYDPATIKLINSTFGWGGGTVGEITMADFIGTAAGYVHTDTLPYITAANQAIGKLPEGIELIRRIQILRNAISGYYTQPPSDGGENGAGATKGFVMITSSLYVTGANGTNTVQNFGSTPFDGIQYETLDDLITAVCPYIEAQLTVIANIQDP